MALNPESVLCDARHIRVSPLDEVRPKLSATKGESSRLFYRNCSTGQINNNSPKKFLSQSNSSIRHLPLCSPSLLSSCESPARGNSVNGLPAASQQSESWKLRNLKQLSRTTGVYFSPLDSACHNPSAAPTPAANGFSSQNIIVTSPLITYHSPSVPVHGAASPTTTITSGGSIGCSTSSRTTCGMPGSGDINCGSTNDLTSFVSETINSPCIPRRVGFTNNNNNNNNNANTNVVATGMNGSVTSEGHYSTGPPLHHMGLPPPPLPISELSPSAWQPPPPFCNLPHGPERLRLRPLRFKMLPSPVSYEKFFANAATDPSPAQLQQYQYIVMRWYERIVVSQEGARARIRQQCPAPPYETAARPPKALTAEELRTWSEQCCGWWDEVARKRTRRGNRGGKVPVNCGNTISNTPGGDGSGGGGGGGTNNNRILAIIQLHSQRSLHNGHSTDEAVKYTPSNDSTPELCLDDQYEDIDETTRRMIEPMIKDILHESEE